MTTKSDYVTGTISLTNGEVEFTGSGTGWLLGDFREGDTIIDITGATEFMGVIATIDANGAGTLTKPWEGPTLSEVAYRMRYQPDGSRVTARSRQLIELLGNGRLTAIASAPEVSGVVEILPTGGARLVPKAELVSGVDYDMQVPDIAARAAYDGMPGPTEAVRGFAVLVADSGDGRAAIYSKESDASGDWSDPAYVTGPVGPMPEITVEDTITLDPGEDADVEIDPVEGGYALTFKIPAGRGFYWASVYDSGDTYLKDQVVRNNGSTWIALLPVPAGEAPPNLPTTFNAYWELMVQKGQDGLGTGDMVGPGSAVDGHAVVFDGTTGKLAKSLGKAPLAVDASNVGNAAAQAAFRSAIGAPVGEFRNVLINPLFDHNQRIVSGTVTLSAGAYGHDRWKAGASGCTYTFSTNNGVTTINISAGSLLQPIEAGAFAGRGGDYVLSWAGTAQGRINSGSYGNSGEVSATCDGSANVSIEFGAGTVSLVQFEREYVTEFSTRSSPLEQVMCERFHQYLTVGGYGYAVGAGGGTMAWSFQNKTEMRVTPSAAEIAVINQNASTFAGISSLSHQGGQYTINSTATGTVGRIAVIGLDAEL